MRRLQAVLFVLLLTLPLASCELIGDLLQFGMWVILIFILLVAALVWALKRAFRRPPPPPPTARM